MSSLPMLLDEDVPEYLTDDLIRLEPALEITQVGFEDAPVKGTKDPDLLLFAEKNGLTLVTMDKRTFPRHLTNHFLSGHHTWGVLLLRQDFPTSRYVEDLLLIWASYENKDMVDLSLYIPL